jgi:thymidylate synthase
VPTNVHVNSADFQYAEMLKHVMEHGFDDIDRTGTGKRSIFSYEMRFKLQEGFPIITAKKTNIKNIISELVWFLAGDTNIAYLKEHSNPIWNEWADANGELGPVYGQQWRRWKKTELISSEDSIETDGFVMHRDALVKVTEIDQIQKAIDTLKSNPESRRIIVSGWNVSDLEDMALPPCHAFFQFWTRKLNEGERIALLAKKMPENDAFVTRDFALKLCDEMNIPVRALSCKLTQRSADTFLGVPFNIASYAILTHMVAQCVNMVPEDFVWSGGDVHIYHNHFEGVDKVVDLPHYPAPKLVITNPTTNINDFKPEDFVLDNYQHGPFIKAAVAV